MLKINRINMKSYNNSCRFTAVAVICFFLAKKSDGELIVIRRLTNEENTEYPVERKITCISDDLDAALVWNHEVGKKFNVSQTTDFISTKFNHHSVCEIQNSVDCSLKWKETPHWKTVNSKEHPMLPVLDYRWESFYEFVINNTIDAQQYISSGEVKGSFGEIAFSVRALEDIHVFICENVDPEKGPCFWTIIGGWKNLKSAIRSCPKGANPWHRPVSRGNCKDIKSGDKDSRDIVSPDEWRTFRINWNATEKRIEIFKSTDNNEPFLRVIVPEWYYVNHVSFRSTLGSRIRFHFYDYIRTTENNALISTKKFVHRSNKFCVKLFVGLCVHCGLIVRLVNTDSKKSHHVGRIHGDENSTSDGLLDWRTERLDVTLGNIDVNRVKLELVTELDGDKADKGQWAIDRLRLCKSDEPITTRSSTLTIKQVEKGDAALNWNKLSCQNLFRHTVVRTNYESIYQDTSRLPEYLKEQKELCGSSCPFLGKGWWLCNPTGCTCDRGFTGINCNDEYDIGFHGHNYASTCGVCNEKSCDRITGSCDVRKERGVPVFLNSSGSAFFETPEVTYVNDTAVMVFQYANLELYRNCRINVHLQLQSKDDPNSWQTSYSPINLLPHLCYSVGPESTRQNIEEHGPLTNNSSNYYTAFIPHLYPNKKHRIWVNGICYASQNNNQIRIFTNTIPFWTTCRGTHLFKIEPGDTYLTVYKRRITECNDRIDALYEISISKVGTNLGHQLVLGNFPVNLTHPRLDPFSKYKVSIADIQDLGNKLFEVIVCTLEAAPDSITRFRFTPTDTTVKLEWEPPIKMNGILRGYEVSIKMVTLLACEEVKKDTPLKDVVIRKSVQKSSVTFEKLHPYVRYNVTVITYTSKPGEPYLDEFETHPTDIPTAKFSNFRFMINFTKLTWSPPEDCTTISGPLRAAVLFFYSSDSMKRVYAIQTEHSTLNLQAINLTAFTNHTVRLYALRSPTSARNPRMYQSLTWMTPATAPPPVTDVTIFDVDPESFTISLRWLPPMPTNGKIELYQVKYLNSQSMAVWNGSVSDKSIMCQLRENFVCAEDIKILFNNSLFKVCAKNEDVEKLGCTQPISLKTINFRNAKPAQPEDILVTPSISGIVNLQWELPKISIKKIKGFEIIYQLSGTKLLKLPSSNDIFGAKLLKRQDRKYELHLLPSSEYKISLFSTDQNVRSEEVEKSFWTRTAIAFADGKELQVSHNGTLINVEIPEIVNITKSTKLEVMVNGPITCDAHSPKNSNGNQTSVMNLIAASYSAGNITDKQLTIGGSKTIENVGSKCDLHYGESYTIVVKIIDESVYYNKSRKIHLIDGEESEAGSNLIWLIILPILVIGIAILFYIWSRRSRITIIRDPIYANML